MQTYFPYSYITDFGAPQRKNITNSFIDEWMVVSHNESSKTSEKSHKEISELYY